MSEIHLRKSVCNVQKQRGFYDEIPSAHIAPLINRLSLIMGVLQGGEMKYVAKIKELQDALEGMVLQFAYPSDNPPRISTGGLSALEYAFKVLGWPDPKLTPEYCCQYGRCKRVATCGTPTKKGYKRVCGEHFRKLNKQ